MFIAAGLFLKEHISLLSIILILWSVFGVYLFTLNKQENSTEENMEFIGYASVLISAWLYGWNFVINKYLILYDVPTIVSPFYSVINIYNYFLIKIKCSLSQILWNLFFMCFCFQLCKIIFS